MIVACACPSCLPIVREGFALVGAVGAVFGIEGCRNSRAAPRSGGAASTVRSAEAVMDRSSGDRGARAAVVETPSGSPDRDSGYAACLASASGRGQVASAAPTGPPADHGSARRAEPPAGARESEVEVCPDSGRVASARASGRGLDDPPDPACPQAAAGPVSGEGAQVLATDSCNYHGWVRAQARRTEREFDDRELTQRIVEIHTTYPAYGAERVTRELKRQGVEVGRRRVTRLMREHGIQGVTRRRRRNLMKPGKGAAVVPDLIRRGFTAPMPGLKLTGEISCFPTGEGWLYL